GKHFALSELVRGEAPYGHFVLVSPTLIKKLDAYRDGLGTSVTLSSGYRSPAYQRAVCRSICGKDACGGICAARSRHSWGDAIDHAIAPSAHLADVACGARFNFVFREGNHMHLDLNPDHKICTVAIL
ncbi:MAG: D-Ala-D-Ala carboxypeptidase family metallohydrolase, partial [Polyangiaceae bacterium]